MDTSKDKAKTSMRNKIGSLLGRNLPKQGNFNGEVLEIYLLEVQKLFPIHSGTKINHKQNQIHQNTKMLLLKGNFINSELRRSYWQANMKEKRKIIKIKKKKTPAGEMSVL